MAPVSSQLPAGVYVVYSVESGDKLKVYLKPPKEGEDDTATPRSTKGIIISSIIAPKLGRGNFGTIGATEDEPCAFDAYEFIRSNCIGKRITFKPEYEIEAINCTAGRVAFSGPDGEDAATALIKRGLATFNERSVAKIVPERREVLVELQEEAKQAKVGIWAPDAKKHIRPKMPYPPENVHAFVSEHKGKELKVRVERILSVTSLLCHTLDTCQPFSVTLCGITAPREDKKIITEGMSFIERMLLNRNIILRIEGCDNVQVIMGSVISPKGTFQAKLLSLGLVKILPGTLIYIPNEAEREEMHGEEDAARSKKLGVWKGFVEPLCQICPADPKLLKESLLEAGAIIKSADPQLSFGGPKDFFGVLTQVISGNMIVVRPQDISNFEPHAAPDGYVRLSLSGVRANKFTKEMGGAKNTKESRLTYTDYAWEAQELLRTRFVGKTVRVHIDYTRPVEGTKEGRPAATVCETTSNVNLGAAVIEAGFAKFLLNRNDSCEAGNLLLDAEAVAKQNHNGLHSGHPSPKTSIVELFRLGEAKAKDYLPFLSGAGDPPMHSGIVDSVVNGNTYRIYIPKQHFQINLKLAGIIAPGGVLPDASDRQKADAFYKESRDFAIDNVQQRDVQLKVYTSDRGGNFIGSLFVNGKNFAVMLVENGLAVASNADRAPGGQQILAAEAAAKAAKKNIWASPEYLPARKVRMEKEQVSSDALQKATGAEAENFVKTSVIDIVDGNTVIISYDSDNAKRQELSELLKKIIDSSAYINPRVGEIVSALYREDKTWHRAKIMKVYGDNVDILFMDYNSTDTLRVRDLRKLPADTSFDCVRNYPPLAITAKLALLRALPSGQEQFIDPAVDRIWSYSEKGQLYSRVDYTFAREKYITISTCDDNAQLQQEKNETLTETLLAAGLAVMDKTTEGVVSPKQWERAKKKQDKAHNSHTGIWIHGDIGVDDEDTEL